MPSGTEAKFKHFFAMQLQTSKLLITGLASFALVMTGHIHLAWIVFTVSLLDLWSRLAWMTSATAAVSAIVVLLLALVLPFLPLAWVPATPIVRPPVLAIDKARHWMTSLIVALGITWAVFGDIGRYEGWPFCVAVAVAMHWLGDKALALRQYLADFIIANLLLPAMTLSTSTIPLSNGRKAKAPDLIRDIRNTAFNHASPSPGHRHPPQAQWHNVTMLVSDGASIDGAYWLHPGQETRPFAQQTWTLWFLANGEVYELNMPEYLHMATTLGTNLFLFNYRGVSQSRGKMVRCSDLVLDGLAALQYLTTSLQAQPDHILFFGRSLGGAVATLVRAQHPGPIVNDRSFSSLTCAAQSVVSLVCKSMLKQRVWLPLVVVRAIAAALVVLDLDVTEAWAGLSSPKLLVFHRKDEMIDYEHASLHKALLQSKAASPGDAIELEGLEDNSDHHNNQISVC